MNRGVELGKSTQTLVEMKTCSSILLPRALAANIKSHFSTKKKLLLLDPERSTLHSLDETGSEHLLTAPN